MTFGSRSASRRTALRRSPVAAVSPVLAGLLALMSLGVGAAGQDATLEAWHRQIAEARILADNDAEAALVEARRLQSSTPAEATDADRARVLNLLARVQTHLGHAAEAARTADEARELATRASDPTRQLEALLNIALNSVYEGDIGKSVRATDSMSVLIEQVDRPDLVAEAMLRSAMSYQRMLQMNESVELTMRSLDIAQRSGDALALAYAHHGVAISNDQAGRHDEAFKHFEAMLDAARAANSKVLQGYALSGRANNRAKMGQESEAVADYDTAIGLFRESRTPFNIAFAQFGLAELLRQQGRKNEALKLLDEVAQRYEQYPSPVGAWFTLTTRSRLQETLGNMDAAWRDAERAQEIANTIHFAYYQSESSRRRAELAAAAGDFGAAYGLAKEAERLMAEANRQKTSEHFLRLSRNYQEEVRQRRIVELTRSNEQQTALLEQQRLRQRWLATVLGASLLLLIGTALFIVRQRQSHRLLQGVNAELRQSRRDLQHQTHVLQSILDSMVDGVAVADADGRYSLVNAAARRIVGEGISADGPSAWVERYGLFQVDRTTPYRVEDLPLARALRGEVCDDIEIFLRNSAHPEGRWLRMQGRPLSGNGDGRRGGVAVFSDVTARKQAEAEIHRLNEDLERRVQSRTAELRQQTRYLRTLIDMLPMWAWLKDTRSRYLAVNQANADACGKPVEEMIGKSDAEVFPPAMAQSLLADDTEVMATRQRKTVEESVQTPDGPVWMETFKAPVLDEDGSLLGTVGVAQDISRRKAVETAREAALAEAERLARLRSDFLAQMSHELRTPLNGILGYAQILLRDKSLSAAQQDGLRTIQHSGEHLLTLINDILDFARIEAGKQELTQGDVPFREFLRVIVDIIRIKAEEKGLGFRTEIAGDIPAGIHIDEKRLRQVLLNLLANAVRYTDSGEICMRVVARSPTGLRFEITDTGTGIDPAQLGAIFEPFVQVGDDGRRSTGTGLGLAISRQYVRLMGSDIHVESQVGAGSRFWFDLEVQPVDITAPLPGNHGIVVAVEGGQRALLVVDDNAENRIVLADMLQPLGFRVDAVASGEEAIELARAQPPDAILIDIVMPGIGGIEAIRRLRKLPGVATRPIIAISASALGQDEAQSLEAGADLFLPKPVQLERLVTNLARMLDLRCIYEQTDAEPEATDELLSPPGAALATLHRHASAGDMRAVLQWVEEITEGDGRAYHRYANRVRLLAERFQSKALLAFVEQTMKTGASETI